jgi:CheY-like chemotaxis protein
VQNGKLSLDVREVRRNDRVARNIFSIPLRAAGADATTAASAEEALAYTAPDRFDLIVSDIAMCRA